MDLQDQLRNLFPNHKLSENSISEDKKTAISHTQTSPLLCKYEKRNGRSTTIIEGFENNFPKRNRLNKNLDLPLKPYNNK